MSAGQRHLPGRRAAVRGPGRRSPAWQRNDLRPLRRLIWMGIETVRRPSLAEMTPGLPGLVGAGQAHAAVTGTPQERLGLLPSAQEHILKQENGKDRCLRAVRELSQAFALAVPHEKALRNPYRRSKEGNSTGISFQPIGRRSRRRGSKGTTLVVCA